MGADSAKILETHYIQQSPFPKPPSLPPAALFPNALTIYLSVGIHMHASHSTYIEVKEQVGKVHFLFPPFGSQGPIQVTRLGSKRVCILRQSASVLQPSFRKPATVLGLQI